MTMADYVKPGAGNLKDFRIDGQGASSEGALTKPTQKVVTRQSSVSEWTQSASNISADNLWADWQAEAGKTNQEGAVSKTHSTKSIDLSRPLTGAPAPIEVNAGKPPKPTEGRLATESFYNVPWSARLALDERVLEQEGQVDFSNSYQKQDLLKLRTREFGLALQDAFRQNIEIFNESRKSPAHMIHVYKVSNSEVDFMLFRNGVKLVISAQQSGRIIFAFNQYLGQLYAPNSNPVLEVEAAWGPFDQLYWTYRSERVSVDDLVRYFVTEFVKQSYR